MESTPLLGEDNEARTAQSDGTGRTCFVTGSTGFVALNLVDELLRQGWTVHALHRVGSSRASMLDVLPHASGSLVHVEGNLCCKPEEFVSLVPRSCEVLYHICHLEEGRKHVDSARKLAVPGFQPEGADKHKKADPNPGPNPNATPKVNPICRSTLMHSTMWFMQRESAVLGVGSGLRLEYG